jgi:hypothetical protein
MIKAAVAHDVIALKEFFAFSAPMGLFFHRKVQGAHRTNDIAHLHQ